MTTFHAGDRVRVLAPSFAAPTGVVTDTANGLPTLTVTVLVGGQEWVFDPTDELELCTDGTEQFRSSDEGDLTDAGHRPVQ